MSVARVVVLGGACVDVIARSTAPPVARTSNPGRTVLGHGGVGRNVAEDLARLGTPTALVACVGRDAFGDAVVAATAAAGVDVSGVVRTDLPTGTWTAVLDDTGELVVSVADMDAVEALGGEDVRRAERLVAGAGLVVVDGNLPAATVSAAAHLAAAHGTAVVLEPVSVPKAARVAPVLREGLRWLAVTPHRDELAALTDLPTTTDDELAAAVDALHARGVEQVWVRDGARGSLLSVNGARTHLDAVPGRVADVTGAGDAALAAYCHALLGGRDPVAAAAFGHAAAALTIEVAGSVRQDLSARLVEERLR